jgi:DNA-binding MarR family transcriptional regulator
MSNTDETAGRAVLDALVRLRAAEEEKRKIVKVQTGLSENDQEALRVVVDGGASGEPVGPAHLAKALEITAASITVMLDRLEKRGLLRRAASTTDRRALLLRPTEAGIALSAAAHATSTASDRLFDTLPAENAAIITQFLERLSETVAQPLAPAAV